MALLTEKEERVDGLNIKGSAVSQPNCSILETSLPSKPGYTSMKGLEAERDR